MREQDGEVCGNRSWLLTNCSKLKNNNNNNDLKLYIYLNKFTNYTYIIDTNFNLGYM